MEINIKIDAESLDVLRVLTDALYDAAKTVKNEEVWPSDSVLEDKAEASEKTKEEIETEPESGENIPIEDVRGALIKVKDKLGPKKAKALLTEFGVSKATDLPEESFKAVLERAERELKNA